MKPNIPYMGILDMQVCVPKDWTDFEIINFANKENPTGLKTGWVIRREGDKFLSGSHERVTCAENPDFVHVMLDC